MSALWAASQPLTSREGSSSAKPSFWAWAQGVRVIGPVFPHGGENIVGRSVDNAHNGIDVVANQGILQALDNGDAAAGGRFEINRGAHFRGKLENLRSVLGQKSLVPRNDGLPARRASVTRS